MMLCVARIRRTGFTLIEIMIVIAIIAILAGIAVPNIAMARFEAGVTACQENCRIGLQAIQTARVRHTWTEIGDMLEDGYATFDEGDYVGACFGRLGDKLIDAGYLARSLRCKTTGNWYAFDYYAAYNNYDPKFFKNVRGEEAFSTRNGFCAVLCDVLVEENCSYHCFDDIEYCTPCYEETFGACFW